MLSTAEQCQLAGGVQVRTRAVPVTNSMKAAWNEQLVLDLAAPSGELGLLH